MQFSQHYKFEISISKFLVSDFSRDLKNLSPTTPSRVPHISQSLFPFSKLKQAIIVYIPCRNFRLPCSNFRLHVCVFRAACSNFRLYVCVFRAACSNFRLHVCVFRAACSNFRLPCSNFRFHVCVMNGTS